MRIIGTRKEIVDLTHVIQRNVPEFFCRQLKEDRHLIGKLYGHEVEIEIEKEPIIIGIIKAFYMNHALSFIVSEHGGITDNSNFICKDGSSIILFDTYKDITEQKLDELWLDQLPSSWNEFNICMSSVSQRKDKIHFFNEVLNNENKKY